jgi:hypothetical protein
MMNMNQAAIYSFEDVHYTDQYKKDFVKLLLSAGFLISANEEVYYHPDHWFAESDEGFNPTDDGYNLYGGDFFTCKTQEARLWSKCEKTYWDVQVENAI